jgi:nucleotidyltransferase substrate binding protein (TIGR01987 family)
MTENKPHKIKRWQYRLENYQKAFALLCEAVETLRSGSITQLEKEGLIQRFAYTWELAWKLLKDYLEDSGVVLESITPKAVIRAAFAAKIINDGEDWLKALDARNRMAHTYDFQDFNSIIAAIDSDYLRLLTDLHNFMQAKNQGE